MKINLTKIIGCAVLAVSLLLTGCTPNGQIPNGSGTKPLQPPTSKPTLKSLIVDAEDDTTIDLGSVEFTADDKGSYTVKANNLTLKNGNVKNATFIVEGKNVVFENLTDIYTVIVDEYVGDADFSLKNCHHVEEVYLNGGGSNSVHISSTEIGKLVANKEDLHIQLDDEGETKIEKVYILQDCSLDSKNSANTLENVIISDAVENLKLDGEAKIDKIISDAVAEKDSEGNVTVNVVITVNVNITIAAADEVVKESISQNTENAEFNNKTDVIEDAEISDEEKEEIGKAKEETDSFAAFEIDLNNLIGLRTCNKGWVNPDTGAYEYLSEILISRISNGGTLIFKPGDRLRLKFKGTADKDIKELSFLFLDNSAAADYWKMLSEFAFVRDIKAGEPFTLDAIVEWLADPVAQITLRIAYDHKDLDEPATIVADGIESKTYTPDFNEVLFPVTINSAAENYYDYDISDCFTVLPQENDIINVKFDITVDKDIDTLQVFFEGNSAEGYLYLNQISNALSFFDIKANETISIDVPMALNSTPNDKIYLCILTFNKAGGMVKVNVGKEENFKPITNPLFKSVTFTSYDKASSYENGIITLVSTGEYQRAFIELAEEMDYSNNIMIKAHKVDWEDSSNGLKIIFASKGEWKDNNFTPEEASECYPQFDFSNNPNEFYAEILNGACWVPAGQTCDPCDKTKIKYIILEPQEDVGTLIFENIRAN